jgi:hypothetical protein
MVHQRVINSAVTWLHILVGPCWCVYVALFFFLFSVGLPVANAPGCTAAMWLIVLPLDVQTLATSRLPKRSWQSEVELNLIIF